MVHSEASISDILGFFVGNSIENSVHSSKGLSYSIYHEFVTNTYYSLMVLLKFTSTFWVKKYI